ncbi:MULTISPECIES: hypothetical protein [unclassified Streptomyces]|uniref:hypothetical protein n=1 Tax=unclassified Streptomyces TaxID=2593676 RepID=UPI00081F4292|nr:MULTISPECIES: hypothetical protein [unclassified Streptomyces]MYR93386.1 hypothetical protein [Streptomyces sp. SID4937]SCD51749.1 hypothetical protein GA0115243_102550 [Streptomyces sp. ScaeMP-e83]
MPTLAQALQNPEPRQPPPRLVGVSSATAKTITTDYGPIVNATGVTPTGGNVVVLSIAGTDFAVGWVRP